MADIRTEVLGKIEKKIKDLEVERDLVLRYIERFEKIGLPFSVVSSDKNPFLVVKAESFEDIAAIVGVIKPSGANALVEFASASPIETASPFSIDVSNYKHISTAEATVKYASDIPVWIKCQTKWFDTKRESVKAEDLKLARAQYGTDSFSQSLINLGSIQRYASGSELNNFKNYAANTMEAEQIHEALGVTAIMNTLADSPLFDKDAASDEVVCPVVIKK